MNGNRRALRVLIVTARRRPPGMGGQGRNASQRCPFTRCPFAGRDSPGAETMTTVAPTPPVQAHRTACADCGAHLPAYRLGKPRVRCESCAADKGALGRAWRRAHPAEVDAYNARRRGAVSRRIRNAPVYPMPRICTYTERPTTRETQ
jgi:hypothetical protein